MKSYTFKVVLEQDKWPDESDEKAVWRAFVPALEAKGAATWGTTKAEALQNIRDVLQMVIEDMTQEGEAIPSAALVTESEDPLVTVTLA